jgi:TolB-like protein
MRKYIMRNPCKIAIMTLMGLVLTGQAAWIEAGQVVTPDIAAWAKRTIASEAKLGAPAAANTVAVLYFHNETGNAELDPLEKGLALMLTTDLSKIDSLQVVERVRLQALVQELDLGGSQLVAPGTAPRLGKLMGARWIVGGGDIVQRRAPALDIGCQLLDLPRDKLLGRSNAQGPLTALFSLEKTLLHDIIRKLNLALTPEQMKAVDETMSTNTDALMLLFKGLAAGDKGHYDEAASYYQKALQADPGLSEAHDNLAELDTLGLRGGPTTGADLLHSLQERTSVTDGLIPDSTVKRFRTPEIIDRLLTNDEPLPTPPAPPVN